MLSSHPGVVLHLVDDFGGDELLPRQLDGHIERHIGDEHGKEGHTQEYRVLPYDEAPHEILAAPLKFV